ncbi:hypothetical protein BKA80DRAFT_279846 [Phyllosticta citrichinensis]
MCGLLSLLVCSLFVRCIWPWRHLLVKWSFAHIPDLHTHCPALSAHHLSLHASDVLFALLLQYNDVGGRVDESRRVGLPSALHAARCSRLTRSDVYVVLYFGE